MQKTQRRPITPQIVRTRSLTFPAEYRPLPDDEGLLGRQQQPRPHRGPRRPRRRAAARQRHRAQAQRGAGGEGGQGQEQGQDGRKGIHGPTAVKSKKNVTAYMNQFF